MRLLYVILLSFFYVQTSQAQKGSWVTIRGKVVDSVSKEAVMYATVVIKRDWKSNVLIKGVVTDADGIFEIQVKKQQGVFCIQRLGYMQFQKELSLNVPDIIDLGVIEMQRAHYKLKEITIKPLIEESADEIRYNLKQDPDRDSANMLEMLEKIPILEISPSGKIHIANSTNYVVVRNGKVDAMFAGMQLHEILKKLPAMGFETIRILRNPPLRYGDVDYVLDIVADRSKRVVGAIGYTSGHHHSYEGRTALTASTSFSSEKLRGYIGAVFTKIESPEEKKLTTQYSARSKSYFEQRYEKKDEADGLSNQYDFSYDLSDKQFITANVNYYHLKRDNRLYTNQKEQFNSDNKSIQYTTTTNSMTRNNYFDATLSYQYDVVPNQKILNISGNLYRYEGKGNGFFHQSGYLDRKDVLVDKTHTYDYKLQVNYFHQFNSQWSSDIDVSSYYREYYTEKVGQDGSMNIMDKKYKVVNGNVAVAYKLPMISIAGKILLEYLDDGRGTFLRDSLGEHYISEKGFEWIPSLRAVWQIPRGSLTANYTSYRKRPNLFMLDPRVPDVNAKILYVGNPNLKSSVNHILSLSWLRMKKITMTADLSFHFSNKNIKSYWYTNEAGQTVNTYMNGAYSRMISGSYSISKRIKKLSFAPTYTIDYQYSKVDEDYTTRSINHLLTCKIQYQFKYGFIAILNPAYSMWHHTKNYTKYSPFSCSCSLRKSWFKGKVSSYLHIKNLMSFKNTPTTYVDRDDFSMVIRREKMPLPIEFSISYSFGNYKVKTVRLTKRKAEIDDILE